VAFNAVVDEYADCHMVVEAVRGMVYPEVRVRPSVPDVVIGEPEIERPVGVVRSTEVTVPAFDV
jgi:hypothetical protein